MALSVALGAGCQVSGEGGWDADGRHSLWACFCTPGPAGQDSLHRSESGISRCYWCGTGIIRSACCRWGEVPQMAPFFFLKALCQNLLKQNLPFLFALILLSCHWFLLFPITDERNGEQPLSCRHMDGRKSFSQLLLTVGDLILFESWFLFSLSSCCSV